MGLLGYVPPKIFKQTEAVLGHQGNMVGILISFRNSLKFPTRVIINLKHTGSFLSSMTCSLDINGTNAIIVKGDDKHEEYFILAGLIELWGRGARIDV